jgi:hypothetical protein
MKTTGEERSLSYLAWLYMYCIVEFALVLPATGQYSDDSMKSVILRSISNGKD